MKINLQGMILNNAGRHIFAGIVIDDNNQSLDATHALDHLILEYAKVRLGGTSDLVSVSPGIARESTYPLDELRKAAAAV